MQLALGGVREQGEGTMSDLFLSSVKLRRRLDGARRDKRTQLSLMLFLRPSAMS